MSGLTSIGFTGTQIGMNSFQKEMVMSIINRYKEHISCVHHGDCIGADSDFNDICYNLKLIIEIHPPNITTKRAFCEDRCDGIIVNEPKAYMERNQDIVDLSDVLIATPGEETEQLRSGTWSTVRKARKKGITVVLITPTLITISSGS